MRGAVRKWRLRSRCRALGARICLEGRAGNCRRRGRTHLLLRGHHAHHGPHHSERILSHRWKFRRAPRRSSKSRLFPSGSIMFFQNVDAIIRPDEPIVYPEHLTEELDYELELAVVLKKSGKHFSAIIPCTTKHPLGWPR